MEIGISLVSFRISISTDTDRHIRFDFVFPALNHGPGDSPSRVSAMLGPAR